MSATRFLVWDEEAQTTRQVTRQQAVGNLMALAAQLGRGTPCAGVLEGQAAEIARGGDAGYTTVQATGEMKAAAMRKAAA
jgi:hypothetical protein